MKRILILNIILATILAFTGCDEFLNETKVVNVESIETAFATEAHADQAITTVYSGLKARSSFNGRDPHVLFDCGSADVKITREENNVNGYTFLSSADDEGFNGYWAMMYNLVGRCNSAIEIIPRTAAPEKKISRYVSEAKVIRAISYYNMMMAYGTVPLVLKTIDPGDREGMLIGDATRAEIYAQNIAALEEAVNNANLPWEKNIPAAEKGHVGQGTVRTILAYYYLTRGWENNDVADFVKAKQYAKEIIDNGGFSLEPVLLDAYYKEFSTESILEIAATKDPGLGSFNTSWWAPLTAPKGADIGYYNGWFKLENTKFLFDALEDGDARKYLLANGVHGNNMWAPLFLGGEKYGGPIEVVDNELDKTLSLPTFMCAKGSGSPKEWYAKESADRGGAANWVIYRLSDVYLLYAEACIKAGGADDEARTYINKVRERARKAWTAVLPAGDPKTPAHVDGIPADIAANVTGDALLALLKNERRVELFSEQKKMIDVRRWSLGGASDLENEVKVFAKGGWESRFKWYPKPKDQVDLSEGNIKQNDGY